MWILGCLSLLVQWVYLHHMYPACILLLVLGGSVLGFYFHVEVTAVPCFDGLEVIKLRTS